MCTFAPVIDARSAGMMSHRSIVLKVDSSRSNYPLKMTASRIALDHAHKSLVECVIPQVQKM